MFLQPICTFLGFSWAGSDLGICVMSQGFDSVANWPSNRGVFSWLRSWFIGTSAVTQGEGHEHSFWQQHRVELAWTDSKAVSRKIFPISAHLKAVEVEWHLLLILQKFVSEIQSREKYTLNCYLSARTYFQKNFAMARLSKNPELPS